MSASFTIQTIVLELAGKRELRLVAMSDGRLSGIASVGNFGKVAAILFQVFVVPDHRGRGIGTALVETACRESLHAGSTAVGAIVEPGGPMGFWGGMGFKPAHVEGQNVLVVKQLSEVEKQHPILCQTDQ